MILADVPEELKDAIIVRCPKCDILYRVLKFNIKSINSQLFIETMCSGHNGFVYVPMTDLLEEKLKVANINIGSHKVGN